MWWRYYGFDSNPLDIRPQSFVVGLDDIERKIKELIQDGKIFLLYGPIGAGKTSLAYKILKDLQNDYNIIYLNGEENQNVSIKYIIENKKYKKFLLFKFVNKKPIVLILDELQGFSEKILEQVKVLYDQNKIHSVFLIQVSEIIKNATPSFLSRVSDKIFLDFPDEKTIIKIIKFRLKNKIDIDENFLLDLIRLYQRNIRKILIELDKILSQMNHPIKKLSFNVGEKIENTEEIAEVKVSPQQMLILEKLINRELTIKQIAELTSLPYNTVSKQISRLYERGILQKREEGKNVYYFINPKYLKAVLRKIGK